MTTKQIPITDDIRAKINKAAGEEVNTDNLAVFRAEALNTNPVRKQHPLYFGGVHSFSFLQQMADEVNKESRPLQIMHHDGNDDNLPIGRVFYGEAQRGTGHLGSDQIEVLFWIDKSVHGKYVTLVDNGTVDQVSVAVMAKEILSNKTGFDFLGPDSDLFDNIMQGKDDKGNIMGKDGAHVVMSNLDAWHELSLVGRGGATGARIKGSGADQRLHLLASDKDVPLLTLQMSIGDKSPEPKPQDPPNKDDVEMDTKEFAGMIEEKTTKIVTLTTENTTLKTENAQLSNQLADKDREIAALKAKDSVDKVTTLETEKTALDAKLTAAVELQAKLVAPLFAAIGKVGEKLDADPAKAIAQVTETVAGLRATFSGSTQSRSLAADHGNGDVRYVNGGQRFGAYSTRPGA